MRPVLYRARWVLPVASPPISHGELLVDGKGRIAAVAPREVLDLGPAVDIRELGNVILLPGLVNVHAHPELGMFRGGLEDLHFRDWILRLVGAKRTVLQPEDNIAAARWSMVESIRAGITTVAATEMSGAGAEAIAESGVRGILFQEVFGPDPAQCDASMRELEEAVSRLETLRSERLSIGISPHAPYTVSDPLYEAVAKLASDRELRVAVHIAESRAERELVTGGGGDFAPGLNTRGIETASRGRSPIALLHRTGILELRPLLIHCLDVDDADIDLIAESGASVAHCPIANARLGHGVAPIPKLRAAGVTVGMGTDSVGSNNRMDLLEEARVASILHRVQACSPDILPASELLELCTIEGARALGIDGEVGTLEPGKSADLCAVSLDGPHNIPVLDPLAALFHSARSSDVVLTVVGGEILYSDGEHSTIDVDGARAGVEAAADRLRQAAAG